MQDRYWGKPNPKQDAFLRAENKFIAYGGARGGGKSWSVRIKAIYLCQVRDGIKCLILRRTYQELEGNHTRELKKMLSGIAAYNESKKAFTFPNGSLLMLGYLANDNDLMQYQGQEYDCIFIDEATQFTEDQFKTLGACLRGVNDFPKRIYLTCNPGGIGHEWVKRLFVDRDYSDGEKPEDYLFIPATVKDNTAIGEDYIDFLRGLPDKVREAWLNGNWDLFDGRYFSEFDRNIHVIKPFVVPDKWERYFAMDYGLDMLAGYWIAVDFFGRAYVYKELYEGKDNGDGEKGLIISEAAERIKELTVEKISTWIAPPDLWNRRQDTGKSAAEIFAEHGIPLYKAGNDRVMGWLDFREWLKLTEDEQGIMTPRLRIFENCINLIRSIPALQHDEKDPNDCAKEPHEITHAPDAIRYFIAARPMASLEPIEYDEDYISDDTQTNSFLDYGR